MMGAASTISPVGDDTTPGLRADAMTGVCHPVPALEPALAYSQAVDLPEIRESRMPAALFATSLLALGAVGASWFVIRPTNHAFAPPSAATISATPAISATAPIEAPRAMPAPPLAQDVPDIATEQPPVPTSTVSVSPPDADASYLAALQDFGMIITDPAKATAGGRAVCAYLREGHSQAEAVALGMRENPAVSPIDAIHAVTAAVLAYCPEMNRRGR